MLTSTSRRGPPLGLRQFRPRLEAQSQAGQPTPALPASSTCPSSHCRSSNLRTPAVPGQPSRSAPPGPLRRGEVRAASVDEHLPFLEELEDLLRGRFAVVVDVGLVREKHQYLRPQAKRGPAVQVT